MRTENDETMPFARITQAVRGRGGSSHKSPSIKALDLYWCSVYAHITDGKTHAVTNLRHHRN